MYSQITHDCALVLISNVKEFATHLKPATIWTSRKYKQQAFQASEPFCVIARRRFYAYMEQENGSFEE